MLRAPLAPVSVIPRCALSVWVGGVLRGGGGGSGPTRKPPPPPWVHVVRIFTLHNPPPRYRHDTFGQPQMSDGQMAETDRPESFLSLFVRRSIKLLKILIRRSRPFLSCGSDTMRHQATA